jgi:hypothetical protein
MAEEPRQFTDFGTEVSPVRCSTIGMLLLCDWRQVSQFMKVVTDETDKTAADTGSLVHHAIAEWYKNERRDVTKALESMKEALKLFPDGDVDDAAWQADMYFRDPRNNIKLTMCEEEIEFRIPCHKSDPTQKEIIVQGKVDQVRREGGRLKVWDIKTSKLPGMQLLLAHMHQVTAYAVGASILLNEPVEPGGLILTRKYSAKTIGPPETAPIGIFWFAWWNTETWKELMIKLQITVARIRGGETTVNPGYYCQYCPAKGPEYCIPKLQKLRKNNEKKIQKLDIQGS